jgi:hypothetical protein
MSYAIEIAQNGAWRRCVTDGKEYRAESRLEAAAEARFSLDDDAQWRIVEVPAEQPDWITTAAEIVWDAGDEEQPAARAIAQHGAVATVKALIESIGCAVDFGADVGDDGPSERQLAEMREALRLAKALLVHVRSAEVASS